MSQWNARRPRTSWQRLRTCGCPARRDGARHGNTDKVPPGSLGLAAKVPGMPDLLVSQRSTEVLARRSTSTAGGCQSRRLQRVPRGTYALPGTDLRASTRLVPRHCGTSQGRSARSPAPMRMTYARETNSHACPMPVPYVPLKSGDPGCLLSARGCLRRGCTVGQRLSPRASRSMRMTHAYDLRPRRLIRVPLQ